MFAPERGVENPIIRRALGLCDLHGMKVIYHEDTVEVWFAPNNKRIYTVWSQFLTDAEAIFGDKMLADPPGAPKPAAVNGHAPQPAANGHAPAAAKPAAALTEAEATELARLRHELKVLERAIRVVGIQREEWKKEAEALKEELAQTRQQVANALSSGTVFNANGGGGGTDRYKALRAVIVRRLHPDLPGSDAEKSYRDVLFKQIWKEVEVLDKK